MNLLLFAKQTFFSIKSILNELWLVKNGQNVDAKILQTAHRIEKGLSLSSHRSLWGWEKAYSLLSLIEKTNNAFSRKTCISVLHAFIQHKESCPFEEDIKRAIEFKQKLNNYHYQEYSNGGVVQVQRDEVTNLDSDSVRLIFNSRHSVRDFDGTSVDVEKIIDAIGLANRCPSACNRQPYRVYVVEDEKWRLVRNDGNQVYGADKHLIVTADISSYNLDETNDWIVSASIFAGYLSLALTVVGLASCVIRKPLIYNPSIEKLKFDLGIPNNEKIIIELAVGNYKENFKVAYSNRKEVSDLVQVVR